MDGFDPNNAMTWTEDQRAVYDTGSREGRSELEADWSAALDGIVPDDVPVEPYAVAEWIAQQVSDVNQAIRLLDAWHSQERHLQRIVEAAPRMQAGDLYQALSVDRERIAVARTVKFASR